MTNSISNSNVLFCNGKDFCYNEPIYNYPGIDVPIKCIKHKLEGMIPIIVTQRKILCQFYSCNKAPRFNNEYCSVPRFCEIHKQNDMIDVLFRKCYFNGCDEYALYNFKESSYPAFCTNHAEKNMIQKKFIHSKKCFNDECVRIPTHNYKNEIKKIYCKDHALPNMVNLGKKICNFEKCIDNGYYHSVLKPNEFYCFYHKTFSMTPIDRNLCKYEGGCNLHASFNIKGSIRGNYCKTHSTPDMVNIKNERKRNKRLKLMNSKKENKITINDVIEEAKTIFQNSKQHINANTSS